MLLGRWQTAAVAVLLIGFAGSLSLNLYGVLQAPTIIGVADSKNIGHGWDSSGDPVTTYTVSLSLTKKDETNSIPIGGTLAYIIEKDQFDLIRDGAVIEGRPRGRLRLEILGLTHAETFETGDTRFYPN